MVAATIWSPTVKYSGGKSWFLRWKATTVEKMRTMVSSLNALMLHMLKWRRKRGVTAFLPPPGGPMAAITCRSTSVILEVSFTSYLKANNHNREVSLKSLACLNPH